VSEPTPSRQADSSGDQAVPRGATRGKRRWLFRAAIFLCLLFAGLGLAWVGLHFSAPSPFPLPPISSSPFQNTRPEAGYVGSETCTNCHQGRTASFRRGGMGISMAEVDPALEPADAAFVHAKSQRRYQITRKAGQLWHRELLMSDRSEEIVLSEYPVKYVVGSGRHARTYLVEADGFLVESPVTWYASRQAWDMSPGYDRAEHQSFERAVGESCLVCHAGQARAVGKSQHRMHVQEAAVSCERCHGPGSLHVGFRTNRPEGNVVPSGDRIDYTIVNPRHLPRALAEAVCQQCHLSGAAVVGRGRKLADFRPGLPLEDFRQDYWLEVNQQPMTVVGHVEQMHLSACYKESATLTCITCHDPHSPVAAEKRLGHYQRICQTCHEPARCTVPAERRRRESPANDCVHCHMPTAPTDISHVAFTHHRIAVHEKLPQEAATPPTHASAGILRPFLDFPRLGAEDKKRSLGLGYLKMAKEESHPGLAARYHSEAFQLLTAAHKAGLPDPEMEAKLARLYFEKSGDEALALAEQALAHESIAGADRCTALFVVAGERLKRNQQESARTTLRELTTLRRHPDDWLLLAECEKALGNTTAAVEALQMAARINPSLGQVHQFLAQHYRRMGDPERAAWHQTRASP
jgi:hypothetical protein